MTTCAQIRDLIDDALDGRLDAGSRSAFDAHVRGCAGCAAEWEFASSLRSSLLKVGLDPAPAGLKESIAADVRRVAGQPDTAVTSRRSVLASPPFLRAAAGVFVVVAIGWFVMRPKAETPAPSHGHAPMREVAPPRADDLVASKSKAQEHRTTVDPAGEGWSARAPSQGVEEGLLLRADPRSADALGMVRTIAGAGTAATAELNRVGGVPEQRVLQASTLALLHANLAEVTEAAGDVPAIRKLAEDADESLLVFAPPLSKERDGAEKKKMDAVAASSDSDTPPPGAKAEDQASAMKVTPAKRTEGEAGPDRASGGETSPAFYVVSGPGVIARAERVLADRGVGFRPVWLKDQDPNLRKRAIEQQASEYRIVEADVPESVLDALIGDLESLDGVRLAPVGRAGDRLQASAGVEAAAPPPASPKVPPASGGRGAASGGAGDKSAPASQSGTRSAASRSNPLPTRKLRLILIAR
jgi:Putative zinc-finger